MGCCVHVSVCLLAVVIIPSDGTKVQTFGRRIKQSGQSIFFASKPASKPVVVVTHVGGVEPPYDLDLHASISKNEMVEHEDHDLLAHDSDGYLDTGKWHEMQLENILDDAVNLSRNASQDEMQPVSNASQDEMQPVSTMKTLVNKEICDEFAIHDMYSLFHRFCGLYNNKLMMGEKEKEDFLRASGTCYGIDLPHALMELSSSSPNSDYDAFQDAYKGYFAMVQTEFLSKAVHANDPKRIFHVLANWGIGQLSFAAKEARDKFPRIQPMEGLDWKVVLLNSLVEEEAKARRKDADATVLIPDWRRTLQDAPIVVSEEDFLNFWHSIRDPDQS